MIKQKEKKYIIKIDNAIKNIWRNELYPVFSSESEFTFFQPSFFMICTPSNEVYSIVVARSKNRGGWWRQHAKKLFHWFSP